MKDLETRYLERLSDLYPTIAAASTEIINLQAILNLPKGTELVEESFMMCWKDHFMLSYDRSGTHC